MATYKGIDVSEWQGSIDWKKVKASGIDCAIIRYADGTYLDPKFDYNMKNAKANGIHIGAYIFSRSKTKEGAEKEAERLYKACKQYKPDMPLYIDLEASGLEKTANTVAQAFLQKMDKLGGKGGVYANLYWFNHYLADTLNKYPAKPMWVAQYYSEITHKNPSLFGMWQFTSSSKVKGIKGNVDGDYVYVAYWKSSTPAPKVEPKPYSGSLPTTAEIKTASNNGIRSDIADWTRKIAKDGTYKYKKWTSDEKTHQCPICKKLTGKYKGWNCIGFAYASWHHGGKLDSKCSCGVINNATAEKMLKVSTDSEALRIAQDHIGLKDIKVIRSRNGIDTSKLKMGDIMSHFDGNTYVHTTVYLGNGKLADDTSSRTPNIKADVKFDGWYTKNPPKVLIRYTGGKSYIGVGDQGDAVRKIQSFLNWYGNYKLTIDGLFGAKTEAAVKSFQKKQKLTQDGLVGSATIAKMKGVKK